MTRHRHGQWPPGSAINKLHPMKLKPGPDTTDILASLRSP